MTKLINLKIIFIIATLHLTGILVNAEYYTFTDEDGNVHYTDNPSSIPRKIQKRVKRVDVEMSQGNRNIEYSTTVKAEPVENVEAIDTKSTRHFKKARNSTKSSQERTAIPAQPPAKASVSSQPANIEANAEPADPSLSTPLKTIRLFRRSLARGDYTSAAKCLRIETTSEVQAYLSLLPKEFASMLSEEFSEAIELVRSKNHAVYMIGDPRKQTNKIMGRHEVTLERVGQNWKISH